MHSFIEKLEAENRELRRRTTSTTAGAPLESPSTTRSGQSAGAEYVEDDRVYSEEDDTADVANPLLEDRLPIYDHHVPPQPVYVGGAACAAFASRLGSTVRGNGQGTSTYAASGFEHAVFRRSIAVEYPLPNRAYTQVLVQVVLRFVGYDYHLMRKRSLFERIDEIYRAPQAASHMSLCRLFVTLALGELYLKKTALSEDGCERTVPGTNYFLQAVSLFEEKYEEPNVDYIETLLLLVSLET